MTAATSGLFIATFLACFVEAVEAATIVMALGFTRGWRSTLYGIVAALVTLVVVSSILRLAIIDIVPESALQVVIGGLLLIFGLQWMRKAILRAAGRKAIHNEAGIYADEVEAARAAQPAAGAFDPFAFVVSFKGVFLEGMEVVFIVITFGLNAHNVPVASVAAAAAVVVVSLIALAARRPLSMIDENLLKYGVGLLLTSFGTFWAIEGMGVFRSGKASLSWPGADWAILVLVVGWFVVSRILIALLKTPRNERAALASANNAKEQP
jgi:uncharacterized membrane protein